jgi:hypothetical protein
MQREDIGIFFHHLAHARAGGKKKSVAAGVQLAAIKKKIFPRPQGLDFYFFSLVPLSPGTREKGLKKQNLGSVMDPQLLVVPVTCFPDKEPRDELRDELQEEFAQGEASNSQVADIENDLPLIEEAWKRLNSPKNTVCYPEWYSRRRYINSSRLMFESLSHEHKKCTRCNYKITRDEWNQMHPFDDPSDDTWDDIVYRGTDIPFERLCEKCEKDRLFERDMHFIYQLKGWGNEIVEMTLAEEFIYSDNFITSAPH